jgi:ribosomal protein S18 acetylase RimI-like enzyme
MRWVGYGPDTHALFGRTIAETYQQSLDCPRLNGLRDIEDVLAGHKASGEFDPRLWALLVEGETALGALLLARAVPADTLELVYLGLTPAARGRGLGDGMMRRALASAAADGAGRLSLAVDSDNVPALKLYYRHGMQRVGAKLALMRQLRRAPQE